MRNIFLASLVALVSGCGGEEDIGWSTALSGKGEEANLLCKCFKDGVKLWNERTEINEPGMRPWYAPAYGQDVYSYSVVPATCLGYREREEIIGNMKVTTVDELKIVGEPADCSPYVMSHFGS